jgi:hypothetical protein
MAQLVVSTAVAAATFVGTGGNAFLTQLAFAGTSALFGAYKASRQRIDGPRLTDAQVTSASYGEAIPYVLGSRRVSGQVWWQSERRENATTTSVGKGGGPKQTSYTYERDFLFGLTSNPKGMLTKVWLNGKLVWSILGDAETIDNSQNTDLWSRITFYSGADDQLPDPTYEAAVGTANAPAYRGRSSVFIEAMQLGNSGQLPNLTFEVQEVVDNGVDIYYKDLSVNDAVIQRVSGPNDIAETTIAKFGQSVPVGNAAQSFRALANTPSQFAELTALSAECWFYRTSTSNSEAILAYDNSFGLAQGWYIRLNNGILQGIAHRNNLAVVLMTANASFPNNQWVFVRFTLDATGGQLWQNGVLVASQGIINAGTPLFGTPPEDWLRIAQGAGGAQVPNGFIDEIRISNIVRTGPAPTSRFEPDANTVFLWRCDAFPNVQPTTTTVRASVEALCARAGMPAGTYDASALTAITQPVRSVIIGQPGATRSTLEQLQAVYFFESTLSDKLYFRPRATAPVAVLPRDELGAGNDAPQDDAFPITVESDIELPPQVVVRYANVADDYQVGTEYSDRLISGQVAQTTIDLAIGLEPAEAKAVADKTLMDGLAGLLKSRVTVPMRYSAIEPGDIVQIIDDDARSYRMRVGSKTDSMGLLTWDVIGDDDGALLSQAITDEGYTPPTDVTRASATQIRALDIPLLRDSDDGPGYYIAAKPTGQVWPGCQIFSSANDVDFTTAAQIGERAIFGVTTTTLPDFAGGAIMDEVSRVTVTVGAGQLSSTTRDALFADETINAILLGDEIVRYVTATPVSGLDNSYTLSRLLRGQRGTEWAMGTHTTGERAIVLQPQGLRRVVQQQSEVGTLRYIKGVTIGQALSTATSLQFTNTGVSQRPLAPVDIRGTVQGVQNLLLSWKRRSRLSAPFLAPSGVPLGEATERYVVSIYAPPSTLRRTIDVPGASQVVYTRDQQAADGFSAGDNVRVDVTQVSGAVGGGYTGTATVKAAVQTQPQVTEIVLGGSFVSGVEIFAQLGATRITYTTQVSDATLAGIAASFAAAIDATSSFAATASQEVITVTGPASQSYSVNVGTDVGDNIISLNLLQTASAQVTGVPNEILFGFGTFTGVVNTGTIGTVVVQRINPALNLFARGVTPLFQTGIVQALSYLGDELALEWANSGNNAAYGLTLTREPGQPAVFRLFTPASEPYNWTLQVFSSDPSNVDATAANTARGRNPSIARPQIITATFAGTVTAGGKYIASIDGTPFEYTASGGDTMSDVAQGLAALIDQEALYIATSVDNVLQVSHVTNNVPFTYSATIQSSALILSAVVIQNAA